MLSFKLLRFGASSAVHCLALLCAAILVFGFKVQDYDLQRLIGPVDNRYFESYTPYYPGLVDLKTQELFNPEFRHKKKIVILGASAADSVGCDASWSKPDETRDPKINAHHSCSISGQLNDLLKERGYSDWRVFDLARNGTSLTPMLYTYARAMEVKPDLVVWGESFPYYKNDNASSSALPADMYRHLDAVFDRPSTKALWQSYRETVAQGGEAGKWTIPPYSPALLPPYDQAEPRERTSVLDLESLGFTKIRQQLKWDMPPRPVVQYPEHHKFQQLTADTSPFINPDPGLAYFQGFGIMGALQKEQGGKMMIYFLPQYDHREQANFIQALNAGPIPDFLDQHGIGHKTLTGMPLKPVAETYDGIHQTRTGNRIIATAILNDLIERKIITRN